VIALTHALRSLLMLALIAAPMLHSTTPMSISARLVRDINPAAASAAPIAFAHVNGTLFFAPYDGGMHSLTLWKSDRAALSAQRVKIVYPTNLTAVGDTLFFAGNDIATGTELWKSDGTTAGTVLVKDLETSIGYASFPSSLIDVDGTLFFLALGDSNTSVGLWKSDGTTAGTVLITKITTGYISGPMAALNGILYFVKVNGVNGRELWRSDGTAAGTVMVKDVNPGGPSLIGPLVLFNGALFFDAHSSAFGTELWRSDGTADGTTIVKDVIPGPDGSYPVRLSDINGELFFVANDPAYGRELWKSDGTTDGTVKVKTIAAGPVVSFSTQFANAGGTLFFTVDDSQGNAELWKSDGTTDGTLVVTKRASIDRLIPFGFNPEVLFIGYEVTTGFEIWQSDGTAVGTRLFQDIAPGVESSNPSFFIQVGSTIFFTADDGVHGVELWAIAAPPVFTYLPMLRT
jgi:ELWxxDGT repeat protein